MFKRNEYIDYLKGIASIGIIAIHTAFWSGQSYTPEWFWNLTLLLDVPFFFYLSGWYSRILRCRWIYMVFTTLFCRYFYKYNYNVLDSSTRK